MISHIRVLGLEHRIQSVRFKETTQLKISLFSFESIKIIFLENTHTYCTINVHVIRLFKNVLYKLKCWINLIIVKHNYLLLIVQAHIYQELDVNLAVFIIIQIFILWCKKELQNTMQIYDIFITAKILRRGLPDYSYLMRNCFQNSRYLHISQWTGTQNKDFTCNQQGFFLIHNFKISISHNEFRIFTSNFNLKYFTYVC